MAKITRILAANICRQLFFVINTAASSRCLVENFQLICYSQRVNATSQYSDSDFCEERKEISVKRGNPPLYKRTTALS